MNIKKGDTVYPANCSREYQLKNPLTINYISERTQQTLLDGEKITLSWLVASENGYSWYSFGTLTKNLTSASRTSANN